LIYDAGDARTTWISFWKAMALLQFGTTLVFGVPPLWNNENQPDERVRKMQAITGKCFLSLLLSLIAGLRIFHPFIVMEGRSASKFQNARDKHGAYASFF
jgi:hypothetical protein